MPHIGLALGDGGIQVTAEHQPVLQRKTRADSMYDIPLVGSGRIHNRPQVSSRVSEHFIASKLWVGQFELSNLLPWVIGSR